MSKSTKKKRSKMRNFSLATKENMSERNRALVEELQKDEGYIDRFIRIFSKWRIITYLWIVFFPPYGLYRVLSKESTFQKSEKYCWTFMIIMYMLYFAYHFVIEL